MFHVLPQQSRAFDGWRDIAEQLAFRRQSRLIKIVQSNTPSIEIGLANCVSRANLVANLATASREQNCVGVLALSRPDRGPRFAAALLRYSDVQLKRYPLSSALGLRYHGIVARAPIAGDHSSKRWSDKAIDELSRVSSYILRARRRVLAEGGGRDDQCATKCQPTGNDAFDFCDFSKPSIIETVPSCARTYPASLRISRK